MSRRIVHSLRTWMFPLPLSFLLWAAGTVVAVRQAATSEEYLMAELSRHGLMIAVAANLAVFAVPYLAAGAAASWTGRGIIRLLSPRPGEPGIRDAVLGSVILLVAFTLSTILGILHRPALFAGMLYLRGGWRRELQLALESGLDPEEFGLFCGILAVALAGLAGAGWWRHAGTAGRVAVYSVLGGLGLLFAVFLVGRFPLSAAPETGDGRPNVLLILVDSLRTDMEEVHAGAGPATPAIDALASRSVVFEDAFTPLARTYPSIASMMTGLHPLRHGVRTMYPGPEQRRLRVPTLPGMLSRNGWNTVAVGGYGATEMRELEFGFLEHRTPRGEMDTLTMAAVVRGHPLIPVWLNRPFWRSLWPPLRAAVEGSHPMDIVRESVRAWRRCDGPFFLAVFFDGSHLPYVPVWPESTGAGDYRGPNRYSLSAGDLVEQVREGELAGSTRGSAAERDNIRRLYSSAVRSTDRAVGRMLDELERDGLSDDTLVVLMADHGQNLLDGGGPLSHGEALERDRSNRIPWLVSWPGRIPPSVVQDPVTVEDLLPTIADLVGLPVPEALDGLSLAPRMEGGPPLEDRPRLAETGYWLFPEEVTRRLDPGGEALTYPDFTKGVLRLHRNGFPCIILAPEHRAAVMRAKHRRLDHGGWSLVYRPRSGGAYFRLYRPEDDPLRTEDLAGREPEVLGAMIDLFYRETRRYGDRFVLEPAGPN